MRRIKNDSIYDKYCIVRYLYQCFLNNTFGVVTVTRLVEVADSGVLGGVVEVVSSNPTREYKYFSTFTSIAYLLYLLVGWLFLGLTAL